MLVVVVVEEEMVVVETPCDTAAIVKAGYVKCSNALSDGHAYKKQLSAIFKTEDIR